MKTYVLRVRYHKVAHTSTGSEPTDSFDFRPQQYADELQRSGKLVGGYTFVPDAIILSHNDQGWRLDQPVENSPTTEWTFVVRADSLDQALNLARNYPELESSDETHIEVREIQHVYGMKL